MTGLIEPSQVINLFPKARNERSGANGGYESFNVFEHLKQAGQKFLIRAKDVNSNGFLSHLTLPQTPTFDVTVDFKLTRRQTKAISMVRS